MRILPELFLTFAKIGSFTFGGGYAMISLIEDTCVERKRWITHEEMLDMTVIAESTPGPIAINCSTYVGYKQAGLPGAVAATLGMALPSFLIIYVISMFLDDFLSIAWVAKAFRGIKIAVGILILDAGITMLRKMKRRRIQSVILFCSLAAMLLFSIFSRKISSITLMLIAGAVNLVFFAAEGARAGKDGERT